MNEAGWLVRLLRLLVPHEWSDDVVSEVPQELVRVRLRRGRIGATVWLIRQVVGWTIAGVPLRLRSAFGRGALSDFMRGDVRVAVRRLRGSPIVSTALVATLALGIGGMTAAFSITDAVLLRPLPLMGADELFAIRGDRQGQSWWFVSAGELQAWKEDARGVSGIAWSASGSATLTVGGAATYARVERVSPGFFDVIGAPLSLGREFRQGEDIAGAAPVVVLAHHVWRTRYDDDPNVLGRAMVIDGVPHTIVGVASPTPLDFLGRYEVVLPRTMPTGQLSQRGRVLRGYARIPESVAPEEAARELHRVMEARDVPSFDQGWVPRLVPLKEEIVGPSRPIVLLVLGAVFSVMMVASLNVIGLLFVQAQGRRTEASVRWALGARPAWLFRQGIVEALVLTTLGAVVGVVLTTWGVGMLLSSAPDLLPRTIEALLHPRVMAFSAALTLATGVLFGVVSGWTFSRGRGASFGTRAATPGRYERRVGAALVAAEMAFALILLVGAGLTVQSLAALESAETGFRADALVVEVALSGSRYPTLDDEVDATDELRRAFAALPGVVGVGSVSSVPMRRTGFTGWHVVESLPQPMPGEEPTGGVEMASPGYFDAQGIAVLEGRTFEALDGDEGRAVAVVSHAMKQRFWPDRSPIGDRVRYGPTSMGWLEVVGVVDDVRYEVGSEMRPRMYVPERRGFGALTRRSVVVRSSLSDAELAPALRRTAMETLPDAAVVSVESMSGIADEALAPARLQAVLLTLLGAVGLGLGAVGVYGLVSYQVARRTREVGLRLALGATRLDVTKRVVRGALRPVLLGAAVGAAGAVALGGVVDGVLYGARAADPVVLTALVGILVSVAVLASLAPAVRAARSDPGRALAVE